MDRVAADLKLDPAAVRMEIEQLLQHNAMAPFNGLAGEKFVNVLELNLLAQTLWPAFLIGASRAKGKRIHRKSSSFFLGCVAFRGPAPHALHRSDFFELRL